MQENTMTEKNVKRLPREGKSDLHIEEDAPLDWFEALYSGSNTKGDGVPWANMKTHPIFASWLEKNPLAGEGKKALVVGCGLGDDAIELEALGFEVTAFDVSDSAIALCKKRFSESGANFVQANLFEPPVEWAGHFDFVLEIYTVQAVPPSYEEKAIGNIARFVALGGQLLVIAEVGEGERSFEKGPPWLLTPGHVDAFAAHNLKVLEKRIGDGEMEAGQSYITTFSKEG
jgi:ubiquinone/menaquinone biosynthesis C-methylase UbiE